MSNKPWSARSRMCNGNDKTKQSRSQSIVSRAFPPSQYPPTYIDKHPHAAAARSSLTALIKDLRAQEQDVLSLSSALDKERLEHEKHIEDLETTHAKELATVHENYDRQLAQIEVRHSEELTRVKLWCVMNQPRPNELSRVRERQRRSALEAEVEKTKEKAEMRHSWQDARIQELERENDQVKHQLANLQRDSQWKNWMKTIMS
ncbi:uncharacterized protein J4E79_002671 [Alternaria viburni]|uniref:uncharacterized protein n=1 Tax=Alternaria viburni TaxID=566460 RepID=UPI0020C24839|nr:uncharacterized protein J4E79_002671 [Alternaria viburni]KAI4666632.1 hypothetical protein J4E79_002671 [Alternaria viburni]